MRGRQTAKAIWRPKVFWIAQHVENSPQMGRVRWQKSEEEWEKRQVTLVADMIGFICGGYASEVYCINPEQESYHHH